jgi:SAM-dependent methyltransferase
LTTGSEPRETWASGNAYEQYIGRWSRPIAREFIAWLGAPRGKRWLEIGCGTGALSTVILELAEPALVEACDPSESHVSHARNALRDRRIKFSTGTVESLDLPADSVDVIVSGLVLNFMPDPAQGLAEMLRIARKGGTVAAYVWDYAGKMELVRYFWDAASSIDPASAALDEGNRFPLCRPYPMKKAFASAGIAGTEISPIDIRTKFESFEDYWVPFLGGQGPAPGYAMSLPEEERMLLRERLRERLPIAVDGSILLTARAWAIKGMKK